MSTSNGSIPPLAPLPTNRGPLRLRLRLAERSGTNRLHGGWWPRSRGLALELTDLADHFPARLGRIVRVVVSRADWDAVPERVAVAGGHVTVETDPGDDAHLVRLTTSDRREVRVLVVPPGFTHGQGAEALLAAATRGNAHSAADLLEEVTENPDVDPRDLWTDGGDTWWAGAVAPSFRTGR